MTELTQRQELVEFARQLWVYLSRHAYRAFFRFEAGKDLIAGALYHQRGRYARPFLHSAMLALIFFGITFGPKLVRASFLSENESGGVVGVVFGQGTEANGLVTIESQKTWNQVSEYTIKDGDTLSGIAEKFDVSVDSIKWANESINWQKIKEGQVVSIPPVTGIVYKVKPGDTVYSLAKKFQTDAQAIVDFPLNTFSDDETFALVAGQTLVLPDAVMPDAPTPTLPRFANVLTPDAGAVSATGSFAWPAFGRITQGYRWYHPAIDIANHDGGAVLAADAGRVETAGWSSVGYGNHVVINHENGYRTLYAHLASLSVQVGQRVNRGAVLGMMGSTGRSTGTHLHFEIQGTGGKPDPLGYLK